jgi:hypothetical protein
VLHHQGGSLGPLRRDQQVHVVGHQHVGVDGAAVLLSLFFQRVQIPPIVLLSVETGRAIIPALDDVPSDAWQREAARVVAWNLIIRVNAPRPSYLKRKTVVCPPSIY